MNFVLLALPAIKSLFRGDYATPRSQCFSLRALDASVHFGTRSLAQHKLSSPDFSVHRGSSCSYRRSGVDLRSRGLRLRSSSVCSSLHSVAIVSLFRRDLPLSRVRLGRPACAYPLHSDSLVRRPGESFAHAHHAGGILDVTRRTKPTATIPEPLSFTFSDNHGMHRSGGGRFSRFLAYCLPPPR